MRNLNVILLMLLSAFMLMLGACAQPAPSNNGGILPRLEISDANLELYIGQTKQIKAYSTVGDEIIFVSLNSDVASVNDGGLVTAKSAGETFIIVKAGQQQQSCKVTVKQETFSVSLDQTQFNILVGAENSIKMVFVRNGLIVTEGATFKLSENLGTFKIEGEQLIFKAQKVGQCKLIVTFGTASAECLINVVEA